MANSHLTKRETIALEVLKSLIIKNDDKTPHKDILIDAFEIADEFIWISQLSTEESKAAQASKSAFNDGLTNAAMQNTSPNDGNEPSFLVFNHDHPKKK